MFIAVVQIILAVVIIALILLQERTSGMSGLFGGGGGDFYQSRRGMERSVFYATILLSIIFVALAIYQLMV